MKKFKNIIEENAELLNDIVSTNASMPYILLGPHSDIYHSFPSLTIKDGKVYPGSFTGSANFKHIFINVESYRVLEAVARYLEQKGFEIIK